MTFSKFSTLCCAICVFLAGCARIADPKPPERRAPETARDLEAHQIGTEGARSEILKVEARDVFPPAPPANFTAVAENGKVILFWTPSPSADVAGYRIFRKDSMGFRRPLREGLITGISYRDENVEPDGDYIYEIQAVDGHGNASEVVIKNVIRRRPL